MENKINPQKWCVNGWLVDPSYVMLYLCLFTLMGYWMWFNYLLHLTSRLFRMEKSILMNTKLYTGLWIKVQLMLVDVSVIQIIGNTMGKTNKKTILDYWLLEGYSYRGGQAHPKGLILVDVKSRLLFQSGKNSMILACRSYDADPTENGAWFLRINIPPTPNSTLMVGICFSEKNLIPNYSNTMPTASHPASCLLYFFLSL